MKCDIYTIMEEVSEKSSITIHQEDLFKHDKKFKIQIEIPKDENERQDKHLRHISVKDIVVPPLKIE